MIHLSPILISCLLIALHSSTTQATDVLDDLINDIKTLENNRDPKCYATSSRLEDFMYGTPLSSNARFKKIELQKALILDIWQQASTQAQAKKLDHIDLATLAPLLKQHLMYQQDSSGHWHIMRPDQTEITIHSRDKRQYSSIAYALRAILAVQQDALVNQRVLTPLSDTSLKSLQNFLDIITLGALQLADETARLTHREQISASLLSSSWAILSRQQTEYLTQQTQSPKKTNFTVLKKIIDQKIASYQNYNHITEPIFLRNLQVYFAKHPWPKDKQLRQQFKATFTEIMIQYSQDLMLGAEKIAIQNNQPLIRIAHVKKFANDFIPHNINQYEDATFFPRLDKDQRFTLEAYDMDAFRDGGLHWRYLQSAINATDYPGALEPDPFATELLVENIAQFGVLLLRITGTIAKQEQAERLHPKQLHAALKLIQSRVNKHAQAPVTQTATETLASSSDTLLPRKQKFFNDVTASSGLQFMHRSSNWLSRLIRSYTLKTEHIGEITIPPAFGGSGVAAEDINQDGHIDILLLSGLGNKLYLNTGNNTFQDITTAAGLDWTRTDGHAGEPRQPIIADFDNDGQQDILITYVNNTHRIYRNTGDTHFKDMTSIAKLGGQNLVGGPAVVFDYDNDGLLDIYIGYFGDYLHGTLPSLARRNTNGLPNKLFHNKGNFQFEDVTQNSGLDDTGWGQAVAHTDLDRDGWQDIIVGNDFGVNAYYRNLGNGQFQNIASDLKTNKPSYTMSIGLTDLNKDLYPDIYISNIVTMNKDEKYVLPNQDMPMKFQLEKLANMRVVEANDLFISQSKQTKLSHYTPSKQVERGYSSTGWSWGAEFFDVDNDGDDDLYVVNGMNDFNLYSTENPYYTDPVEGKKRNVYFPDSNRETNVFFINANGKLQNMSKQSGADLLSNSRSVAYLDYDNDGDLDMLLNNYHQSPVLYRNNAELLRGHWLKIKLIGDPKQHSNRDAIGARIIIKTSNGLQVWREVHGGSGYLTLQPKLQHFGVGNQTQADITVEWPNGQQSHFEAIATNHTYTIDQSTTDNINQLN